MKIYLGVDYAVRHNPSQLSCLATQGVRFVVRYLSLPSLSWKRLTLAEAHELAEAGLALVSVYQARMNRIDDFTLENARRDAEVAAEHAEQVGQPFQTPIYFAVDFDAKAPDIPTLKAYFQTVKEILSGRYYVGVYGSINTCNALSPFVAFTWQTYAWSNNHLFPEANLYQFLNGANVCGGNNDLCLAFGDPGFWRPGSSRSPGIRLQENWHNGLPLIKRGAAPSTPGLSTKALVKILQASLFMRGVNPGPIDGIFGPKTEDAVKEFQIMNSLSVDGIVGSHTWDKLINGKGEAPPKNTGEFWREKASQIIDLAGKLRRLADEMESIAKEE